MEPYDLNTEVVSTYLTDFHGQSNAMYAMGAGEPGKPMATCTDCHGIHDIPSFKTTDKSVVRERVVKVCQSCHQDVPEGFADAWLSHYPPTLESAPLVWAVTWFYRIIIPLILAGLVLHILLDLWRVRMSRRGGES
jgi:predicted CXXCH cytochrome family protein